MKRSSHILATALICGLFLAPSAVRAQTVDVSRGDTVWRVDDADRRSRGVVQSIAPSALTVLVDGQEQQWRLAEMRELWREGDSRRNGAIIGALAGAGAGLFGGFGFASLYEDEERASAGSITAMTALGAVAGAGLGVAIDTLVRGRTLLYRRAAAPIVIRPALSGERHGIQAVVRF